MKEKLFSLLGIEPGEESLIATLLTQSVFLGIFLGSFDISAHSLFLSVFDEKMMARGYVVSGFAGIILTTVYTFLQTRLQFRNFSIFNLGFVTALTLLLWVMLLLIPGHWIVFLVFIMLGPLNILAMLGFWGTASRLLTLRQGKRLFGLVDSGLVVGGIISCYTIPVLLSFSFKSHNILVISAFSIFIATIIQGIIRARFFASRQAETPEAPQPQKQTAKKKSVFSLFREDHYVRILGSFIALSVMTAFFVMYSFMAVTREQYPLEQDMARFLGLFTGSMMIFTLLMKLTVFAYLIRNYGLRTCLALSPILIAFLSVAAVVLGSLLGYSPGSASFLIFFMILALGRLFSKSLKDSIESPSFKIVYLTIDEKSRYEVQSSMDGTVNEIAALSSGILLAGLGMLSFIKLIHFSLVLVIIAGLWITLAFKVYSEYRKSIRRALESASSSGEKSLIEAPETGESGKILSDMIMRQRYYSLVTGDFSSLESSDGTWFREKVVSYAELKSDVSLLPALKRIISLKDTGSQMKDHALRVSESLEHIMSSAGDKDDRLAGTIMLLPDARPPQTTQILRLLRSNQVESRSVGLLLIGKYRIKELIQEAFDCLDTPGLRFQSRNVVKSFGSDINDNLQRFYLMSSGNQELSKTILRIMAEEGSEENKLFLFSRLWTNSRQVRELTLGLLSDLDFRIPEGDTDRVHQLIFDIIGIIVWNLSARVTLEKANDAAVLPALNAEIARWRSFFFTLLSITYEKASVARIRENIESETVESVNYALEMIDIVVDDALKPRVIPLLDPVPDEIKVRNLYQFYPGEIHDRQKLVNDILNRDYNLLGIWIRACALSDCPSIENDELGESVIALLFSPEAILREEAARLVARSGSRIFEQVSGRINDKLSDRIERFMSHSVEDGELILEKVRFLKKNISTLDEDYLIGLAVSMKYERGTTEGNVVVKDNSLVWATEIEGRIYSLPLFSVEDFYLQYPEKSEPLLEYIENIRI
jgi:ATP:ADP antiporter, AAA family